MARWRTAPLSVFEPEIRPLRPLLRAQAVGEPFHLLDIGENKPLKTAILAAFFVFSVKLFESEALSNFG
jgi:hypothetical protein